MNYNVINNLPYGCSVELEVSGDVDAVYYSLQESRDTTRKLLFQSVNVPNSDSATQRITLPAISIHQFQYYPHQEELWLVCLPVHRTPAGEDIIGAPVFYFPIKNHKSQQLGVYDLDVDFKGEDLVLFQQVKPLIEKHFGKAALPGKVNVRYSTSDIYYPSLNVIQLSNNKNNLIHELIHASRKQLLFSSEAYRYTNKTELIEEAFAEGIANMVKDELNLQPNNHLQEGAVYGSTMGYNYDFRIQDKALITQDIQSTQGGILNLETSRYYLGSEAFHKIALEYYIKEGKYFGKEYNAIYYDIVERTKVNPDKELFYSICEQLMPTIEQKPCREWLDQQMIFNCEIIPGEKLYMHLRDYQQGDQWIGMCYINLYETFRNGSDWRYGVSRKYRKNGSAVNIVITHVESGKEFFNDRVKIPNHEGGFGTIKFFFHHLPVDQGVNYFTEQDDAFNIPYQTLAVKSGLYRIQLSTSRTTTTYYRLLGECLFEHRDRLIVGIPKKDSANRTIQLVHTNKQGQKTYIGSQRLNGQFCSFEAPFIKDRNCEPGLLEIIVKEHGWERKFQRTIGYGNEYGGHQFWLYEMGEGNGLLA